MWANRSANDSTAGGGFLNTTTNQLDATENKVARRIQNIMPLVIRQIENYSGEEFKLFGVPAQIIKLVGILRNFEVQTTKASYTIEDHTGEITAILWLESDGDNATNLPSVKEGSYVEVFGSLRMQDDGEKRILMVLRMFPVSDNNIIVNHLLRVVHNRLSAEADSKKMMSDIKVNNPGAGLANSMSFVDIETNTGPTSGLTPMQKKIFDILATDLSINGMSKEVLMNHFNPNQRHQVNEALTFLSNEGHVYSTTDNDHFKVTLIN